MKSILYVVLIATALAPISAVAQAAFRHDAEISVQVVDASSDATFEASLARLKEALPAEARAKFDQASFIVMSDFLERATEVPESIRLEKLRAKFQGMSAADIIGEAEAIVTKILDQERQRRVKVTAADLPDLHVIRADSLVCEAILSTSIEPARARDADRLEISGSSFLKSPPPNEKTAHRVEASSALGTDKLAVEIKDRVLRLLTRAALDLGDTSAAEFEILSSTPEWVYAIDLQEGLVGGTLSSFVLNKKAGLAVWTKSRPVFLIVDQPDTQSYYLRCQ